MARSNGPEGELFSVTVALTLGVGGGGVVVPMLPPPHAVRTQVIEAMTTRASLRMSLYSSQCHEG
jgi:hypothetical protein